MPKDRRRYVESLSAYARQFLSMMEKPDIDHVEGLSPAISIEQKSTSHNPRSTVGTITEIYDYLRLLFARVRHTALPGSRHNTGKPKLSVRMVDHVLDMPADTRLMLLAPIIEGRKGEHIAAVEELRAQGFIRARIDGEIINLDETPELDPKKKHSIEAVVDRFKVRDDIKLRLAESFETALRLSDGRARIIPMDNTDGEEIVFSAKFACSKCGYSISELEPRTVFSQQPGWCLPKL